MKKLLLSLLAVASVFTAKATEQTSSFSLVSFTAGNPVAITSTDNTDVSLSIGRSGTSNVSADSKSRGLRVQAGRYFEITVPEGTYITKVDFTSGSNGNPDSNGSVGIWSVTGETSNWNLGGKTATYTWTNGGTNFSSPMTFTNVGGGDAYISAVKVYYDDQPVLENEAPTITQQPVDVEVLAYHQSSLSIAATGVPTPTYQWYSNTSLSNENGTPVVGATSSTYQFTPETPGTYYYYAVASNSEGNAVSDCVTVIVNECYSVSFSKGTVEGVIGTVPTLIYTDAELKATIPANYSLALAGKTLTSWTDGVNDYVPGEEYTLSANLDLTPVFSVNTTDLSELAGDLTVKFIKSTSVAATYQSSTQNAIVEQVSVNGQTIDVALLVQNGKFDLQPAGPRAQTNQNTVVSIPVVDGAVVVIDIYDNNSTKVHDCSINGEPVASYLDGESTTTVRKMTYTYHGTAGYIDYVVNANNMYANCINVTYPGLFNPTSIFSMKTAATGNVSIEASADHVALPSAANLTINGGSVTVSNGQSSAKNLVTSAGFSMTNGNTFFTVTLDEALKEGDVITATMSQASRGLKFATADAYSSDYPGEASATTAFTYTVVAEDGICGETTFNVFRATGNTTTFNNFKITRPATVASGNTNASGLSTFSSAYGVKISGAKAYTATVNGNEITCTLIEDGVIPANTGVLVFGEPSAEVSYQFCETSKVLAENNLVASSATDYNKHLYVLVGNEFRPTTAATLNPGKAHFEFAEALSASLRINFEGMEDGMETAISLTPSVVEDAACYDLYGRKSNGKGLMIQNGKVVLVK